MYDDVDLRKKLCVVLFTYNRPDYAERALRSCLDNLRWSGRLRVHVAGDGSGDGQREHLVTIAGGYSSVEGVGTSNSARSGYGASYNLSTQHVHLWADLVLCLEDDWVLMREFDADEAVRVFEDASIGCLRLGYLGFTQPLHGEVRRTMGGVVLLLDPLSPEPHVFAGHPRLETVAWEKQVGPWPQGLDPNVTEFYVSTEMARRGVAWPMWLNPEGGLWAHIGAERAR